MSHTKSNLLMKVTIKQFVITLFALALFGSVVSGCKNTAHGAGKDIEKMGEKIQEKTN